MQFPRHLRLNSNLLSVARMSTCSLKQLTQATVVSKTLIPSKSILKWSAICSCSNSHSSSSFNKPKSYRVKKATTIWAVRTFYHTQRRPKISWPIYWRSLLSSPYLDRTPIFTKTSSRSRWTCSKCGTVLTTPKASEKRTKLPRLVIKEAYHLSPRFYSAHKAWT